MKTAIITEEEAMEFATQKAQKKNDYYLEHRPRIVAALIQSGKLTECDWDEMAIEASEAADEFLDQMWNSCIEKPKRMITSELEQLPDRGRDALPKEKAPSEEEVNFQKELTKGMTKMELRILKVFQNKERRMKMGID